MYTFEKTLLYAIPGFVVLMLAEFLYGLWVKRNTYSNQSDTIASLSSGLTYIISNTVGFGVLVLSYDWIHGLFAPEQGNAANTTAWWVWLLTFVWRDFTGYWVHRWAHANNFLWAMHMIHHSSEEFNLAVALRQNAFKWFAYGGLLMAPLVLIGVPVEVVAIVIPVHLFLQFWYHTRHIGDLGWLEYIIVTPSQHRVHHAINKPYIDKNFGLIFCCWDRLFGSFQKELPEEPCAFGITTPVRNYNPVLIELQYIGRMLRDSWHTKGLGNKFAVFFSRTGWRPEDVDLAYPRYKIEDPHNFEKYAPPASVALQCWGGFQTVLTVLLAGYLFSFIEFFSQQQLWLYVAILLAGVYGITNLIQGQGAVIAESIRMGISLWVVFSSGDWFGLAERTGLPGAQYLLLGIFVLGLLLALAHARKQAPVSAMNGLSSSS